MHQKVRIGIVGMGRMGRLHLTKFPLIPEVHLVGFFDPFIIETSLRSYKTLESLLAHTDAIIVSSPTNTHFAIALEALRSKKHVLVEKPLSLSLEECQRLVETAKQFGCHLTVGYLERHRLNWILARLPQGVVRRVDFLRLSTKKGREPHLDVIQDLMVHDLDLWLSSVISRPKIVSVEKGGIDHSTSDDCVVTLKSTEKMGRLRSSFVASAPCREINYYTDLFRARIDLLSNEIYLHWNERETCEIHSFTDCDPLLLQAANFVRSIAGLERLLVRAKESIELSQVVEEIRKHPSYCEEKKHPRVPQNVYIEPNGLSYSP